ncbi:MAG: hypothetical protein U1E76_26640 [Planctomycetota bacterium]
MLERPRRVMQLASAAILLLLIGLVWILRRVTPPAPSARGTLHSGSMAIGGETTGWTIDTPRGPIEVDVRAVAATASALDGRSVVATGQWQTVRGVERPDRRVLVIAELKDGSTP